MSEAVRWAAHEIGCSFSQSFGNINVPETALSDLISDRDRLRAENARLKKTLDLRTLELHAVIETARRVEERHREALEKARVACGMDSPLPVFDVLEQCASWLGNLQSIHDCDCQGHEAIQPLRIQAKNLSGAIRDALRHIDEVLK